MGDLYRLVFRGEVLDGQHPAVVRKRLADAASFDEAALDKLFSGQPVVLKRQADTATAARLQGLFKKVGARLRVLPVDAGDTAGPAAAGARAAPAADVPAAATGAATPFEVLPAGSDILRSDERAAFERREIDTGGLALEPARFGVPDEVPAAALAPDVSHLTVAPVGEDLAPHRTSPERTVPAPDLEIAEVGEDLAPHAAPAAPAVDFATLEFDVAPAGSDLGQHKPAPPPAPPDTSHLRLSPDH